MSQRHTVIINYRDIDDVAFALAKLPINHPLIRSFVVNSCFDQPNTMSTLCGGSTTYCTPPFPLFSVRRKKKRSIICCTRWGWMGCGCVFVWVGCVETRVWVSWVWGCVLRGFYVFVVGVWVCPFMNCWV